MSGMNEWDADAFLPYGGTTQPRNSGYAAGADTSRDRALTDDADGTTTGRQSSTLSHLGTADTGTGRWTGAADGLTWPELANRTGWHHGQASGVLSALHKAGKIARLNERRHRCFVYVLPEYVNGRDTQPHGRKPREGEQPETQLAVDLVAAEAAIRRVHALHLCIERRLDPGYGPVPGGYCSCCNVPYPCATVRALVPR